MNNSIVKLEDNQLDEISGGVTAKQVAKKTAGYAIKGLCTAAFATDGLLVTVLVEGICGEKVFWPFAAVTLPLSGVAGWKIGELVCKEIGLED